MSTGTARREGTQNDGPVTSSSSRETLGLQVIGEGRTLATGVTFYVVPSRSEPNTLYLVYRLRTKLQCTCAAGRYHPETPCVHRQAVRDFLLDRMNGNNGTAPTAPSPAQHPGDTAPLRREPFSFLKR